MRFIPLNSISNNRESILFLNGGGQIHFSKFNSVVKYFSEYDYNLYAVELPGHGKSRLPESTSAEAFISLFITSFDQLIKEHDIKLKGMIGFSLGGLLTLKAIESLKFQIPFVIIYGSGFGIGKNERKTYKYYISIKFFEDMNWTPIMEKNHGEGWKELLPTMQRVMRDSNLIFSDVKLIKQSTTKILLLLGDNDEIFTPEFNLQVIKDINTITLKIIDNTTHFEYTTKSKDIFFKTLKKFEMNYRWYS